MGADAVYLAGKSFGARSYADNFDSEALRECVRYAHLRGVKVYAAVNTLVGDRELDRLREYLKFLDEIRIDALIVQDLAVLAAARELKIRPRLHASTQMTVHNLAGAKAAAELGFTRVVLARELSFDEIKYISENCGIEVEIFIHGAMCMSYSGQCLMSSVLGGRSGNRGRCAQPCRQLYRTGGTERFALSLKDMSLIEKVHELCQSGAASLKIEGRMKGAAYVAAAVKTYRTCLDEMRKPHADELDALNRIFYRGGLTSGYFDGKIGTNMFAFDKPDNPYKEGAEEIEKRLLDEVRSRESSFKIPLRARLEFSVGKPMRLSVETSDGKFHVSLEGSAPEAAKTKPLQNERIIKQLSKTGQSVFEFEEINIEADGNGYTSVSELNKLRRSVLEAVEQEITDGFCEPPVVYAPLKRGIAREAPNRGFTARVANTEQYRALLEFEMSGGFKFELIGVPIDLLCGDTEAYLPERQRIIIEPAAIMHDKQYGEYLLRLERLKSFGFSRLRAENISELGKSSEFNLCGGARLNVTNRKSAGLLADILGLSSVMLSPELNLAQAREISSEICAEVNVYGYQPVMITENCVIRNIKNCPCGGKTEYLTDRLGKKFPIIRDGNSCRTILLNSCPTFMCDRTAELYSAGIRLLCLNFTIETGDEVKKICGSCIGGDYRPREFTRLHFNKGAINNKEQRG